jgi:hypothetical protein
MAIIYLIMRFLIFDIFSIVTSKNGSFCSNVKLANRTDTCSVARFGIMSGYNFNSAADQPSLDIISILGLAITVVSIIYFIWYKSKQYKMMSWLDRNNKSQDDFSILIENVPMFIYKDGITTTKNVNYDYESMIKERI